MARTVAIGVQNFEKLVKNNCFYVDKTQFIIEGKYMTQRTKKH